MRRMGMEMVFTLYFTLELVLRYLATRTTGKTFLADPYVWFDIVAILPFYVVVMVCVGNPFSDSCDLRDKFFINVLQGTKILRVFKISRVGCEMGCLRRSSVAVPCKLLTGVCVLCASPCVTAALPGHKVRTCTAGLDARARVRSLRHAGCCAPSCAQGAMVGVQRKC